MAFVAEFQSPDFDDFNKVHWSMTANEPVTIVVTEYLRDRLV